MIDSILSIISWYLKNIINIDLRYSLQAIKKIIIQFHK